jgi:hypothetical protein
LHRVVLHDESTPPPSHKGEQNYAPLALMVRSDQDDRIAQFFSHSFASLYCVFLPMKSWIFNKITAHSNARLNDRYSERIIVQNYSFIKHGHERFIALTTERTSHLRVFRLYFSLID